MGTFLITAIFLLTSCGSSGGYLPDNSSPRPLPSAPSISAISPASGPTSGGTSVTITASNLQSGATVTFGGVAATSVAYARPPRPALITDQSVDYTTGIGGTSATIGRITAVSPPGNVGSVNVVVTNPDGQSADSSYGFTYSATPGSISSVRPGFGSSNGGTIVSIAGTGFQSNAAILFGGAPGTDVSISKDGTLAQAVAPAHAAGVVDVQVANPDGTSATASSAFTFGTAQIGCGTDCGNVGDPYEGKGRPPSQQPISACSTITTAGNFIVTQNIGTDPTQMCLQIYFPSGPVNIDLGGHTITGAVGLGTNQSPNTIFHGTIVCNVAYGSVNGGACLGWGTPGRIHHITIENSNTNPLANITTPGTVPASTTSPVLLIDHVTSTVLAAPGSKRTRNFMDAGANGSNPSIISLPEEVMNNLITCSANAAVCQGVEAYIAPHSYVHNNRILMLGTGGRGILFDGSNHSVGAYNDITANANRGIRSRMASNVEWHDNIIRNIINDGDSQGGLQDGGTNGAIGRGPVTVYNNTFELGPGGVAILESYGHGLQAYDNTFTCVNNDCSQVEYIVRTDVAPFQTLPTDTNIILENNDVSALAAVGKDKILVCGPATSPAGYVYRCPDNQNNPPPASATVCNSGTAVGNGVITNVKPPCP